MNDKIFVDGMSLFKNDRANWFMIDGFIQADKFIEFLNKYKDENGQIKFQIKESRKGGYYVELDTWRPTKNFQNETSNVTEISLDDIPI